MILSDLEPQTILEALKAHLWHKPSTPMSASTASSKTLCKKCGEVGVAGVAAAGVIELMRTTDKAEVMAVIIARKKGTRTM